MRLSTQLPSLRAIVLAIDSTRPGRSGPITVRTSDSIGLRSREDRTKRATMASLSIDLLDSLRLPGPLLLAEPELLDLAGGGLRELAELHGLRALERGEQRAAVR